MLNVWINQTKRKGMPTCLKKVQGMPYVLTKN